MGQVLNIGSSVPAAAQVLDANLQIEDDLDPTKILQFQVSGITTGTTRTITVPDASGTMYVTGSALGTPSSGDISSCTGSPTLTNITTTSLAF